MPGRIFLGFQHKVAPAALRIVICAMQCPLNVTCAHACIIVIMAFISTLCTLLWVKVAPPSPLVPPLFLPLPSCRPWLPSFPRSFLRSLFVPCSFLLLPSLPVQPHGQFSLSQHGFQGLWGISMFQLNQAPGQAGEFGEEIRRVGQLVDVTGSQGDVVRRVLELMGKIVQKGNSENEGGSQRQGS